MKFCGRRSFVSIILCSGVVALASGCATIDKVTFDRTLVEVPKIKNSGDKYCVVAIQDTTDETRNVGQSPPAAEHIMFRLGTECPEWFSQGENAIPVIIESRSSRIYTPDSWSFLSFLVSAISFGAIPGMSFSSRIDYSIALKQSSEMSMNPVLCHATVWRVVGWKPVIDSIWTRRDGWQPVIVDQGTTWNQVESGVNFDRNRKQKLDAFCASIALAVQKLTPEEREALRENEEAWYLDAKLGNKRKRPVSIRQGPRPHPPGDPMVRSGRPRIVSQSWNADSRRGVLTLDLSGCEDREAALAWARQEYVPDWCRTLGLVVDADNPGSAPEADILYLPPGERKDGTVMIEFEIR